MVYIPWLLSLHRFSQLQNRCGLFIAIFFASVLNSENAQAALLNTNLVTNGGGEQLELLTSVIDGAAEYPGWTPTGTVYSNRYSRYPVTFLSETTGASFGQRYFFGGEGVTTTLTQNIDVSNLASAIDALGLSYTFSGWLGTSDNINPRQPPRPEILDKVNVTATFLSEAGAPLGTTTLQALTLTDVRPQYEFVTVSIFRLNDGIIPSLTRSIQIEMRFDREAGFYSSGTVDDLRMVINAVPEPQIHWLCCAGFSIFTGMNIRRRFLS